VLKDSWEDSKVVPRLVKCYGRRIAEESSGGRYVSVVFNLLIDAILRAVETMMEEARSHEKPTYTSMQTTAALVVVTPTSFRSTSTNAWNSSKRWASEVVEQTVTSHPNFRWPGHTIGAYNRRLSGEPVDYELRTTVLEECEVCGLEMQLPRPTYKRAAQGSAELCPTICTHHHLREEGPRHFDITWDDEEMESPLCAMTPTTHDAMRQHFCYRHYDQGLSFNEDRSYDKCDLCKHVRPARLAEHQESKLCKAGNARRKTRS
jgi:hypothetical protein